MGWTEGSASDSNTSTNSQENSTRTPIISPQYSNAFTAYLQSLGYNPSAFTTPSGTTTPATTGTSTGTTNLTSPTAAPTFNGSTALSPSMTTFAASQGNTPTTISPTSTPGLNSLENGAVNWSTNNLVNSPVDTATQFTNSLLGGQGQQYGALQGQLQGTISNPAPQATASTSAGTTQVNAQTGAQDVAPYSVLYSQNLIDPSLAAYDYGTDRDFSALDARTAGAGAFGNTRSGLAYSDLGAQAALGRGQLESNLLTTGLTNALSNAQTDASRNLTAQTTNAGNLLSNNQFNANLLTNTANNNAALQSTKNTQNLDATQQLASSIAAQSGLSQQLLNNVITANGVDTNAAQALFAAGQITQDQLNTLLAAAQQYNGVQGTNNTTSNTNTAKVSVGF